MLAFFPPPWNSEPYKEYVWTKPVTEYKENVDHYWFYITFSPFGFEK